jgi:hypothetical protein
MSRTLALNPFPDISSEATVPDLFADILRERIVLRCTTPLEQAIHLRLALDDTLQPEGFAIENREGAICLRGTDCATLLAGMGHFLRTSQYRGGVFVPSTWRGVSHALKPIRGIYFATHFHNYFHDAPLAEVNRYVEDLALWGYNVLQVWFDMHHYTGIHDPAAQAMLERLRNVLAAAKRIGLKTGIGVLANEAYATSPVNLRADSNTQRAHYKVELCPSLPGAIEQTLSWFDEEFRAFASIAPDFLWVWPYDQGGCACENCKPWGANGFLRIGRKVGELFKRHFPHGKVILSTWCFDYGTPQGEWEGLAARMGEERAWIDYILAGCHEMQFPEYVLKHGSPGNLPLLDFPEISMYGMVPWGGFGANPRPANLQLLWNNEGARVAGGFPYSEGIFEDFNKVIMAQFYWSGRPALETAHEYMTYECGAEVPELILQAIAIYEANQLRSWENGDYSPPYTKCLMPEDKGSRRAVELMQRADADLPTWARTQWRWRILYLRALIDAEMFQSNGVPPDTCEPWFHELMRIYHAQHADIVVAPPTRETRRRSNAAL